MPYIAEGLGAAEERAEEEKGAGFFRVKKMKFEDDSKPRHIRFVIPQTYSFGIHSGIPTKKKPAGVTGTWQPKMFQICRNDKAFRNRDESDPKIIVDGYESDDDGVPYGDCWSHVAMKGKKDPTYGGDLSQARMQTFGLAVERVPVLDDDDEVIGFRDATEEYKHTDEDGETTVYTIPRLVFVQQTYSNFWAPLAASILGKKKDLTRRDLTVTRKENDYGFAWSDVDQDHLPGTPSWEVYAEAQKLLGYNLLGQLMEWASADWQARWFDPAKTPKEGYGRQDGGDGEGEDEDTEATAPAVNQDEIDATRQRLMAHRK